MAWISVIFCQRTHDSLLRGAVLLTRRRKEPKLSREYLTISPCILAPKPHSIRPSGSRGKGEEAGKCGLLLSIFRYIFLVLDWKDSCYLRSYCSHSVSCTGTRIGTRFPSPEGSVIARVGPRFTLGHQEAIAHILKWACLLGLAAERLHCDAFLLPHLALSQLESRSKSRSALWVLLMRAWVHGVCACGWEGQNRHLASWFAGTHLILM